uniref:6-phosphogluconolactonase (6PGL) n=1 Tax=mine drainage metagenome TaxID=410659 RepID=E6PY27_9ZZZZ
MPPVLKVSYVVEPDHASLAWRGAEHIVELAEEAFAARGRVRLAISGGSTPRTMFALLAAHEHPFRQRMPWDALELFWVDERMVPPDHPDSNYRMTREALLDKLYLKPQQVHRIHGELDPQQAADEYEFDIRGSFRLEGAESPRFDIIALGMGDDGHTASLFPHTEAIHDMSRIVTANHVPQKDTWRVTLTWPVINQAREVFFLIGGADKAQVLSEVFLGPGDVERLPSQLIWPASGILTLILDQAAAAHLPPVYADGTGLLERTR